MPNDDGLDALDAKANQHGRRHRSAPPPKHTTTGQQQDAHNEQPRQDATGGHAGSSTAPDDPTPPPAPRKRTDTKPRGNRDRSEQNRPVLPEPDPQHRVQWSVFARQVRAGLMAWVAARAKVAARESDVRDLLAAADGTQVSEADLAQLVADVADRTGTPPTELAAALGYRSDP